MPLRIWLSLTVIGLAAGLGLWLGNDRATVAARWTTRSAMAGEATTKAPYGGKPAAVDPVAKNGPIFQGWPKPKLALVITGLQQGYLEPCGCAGLDNQKGGLSRRHTLLLQLAHEGWPLVPLDVGGQVQRYGRQTVIKFGVALEALRTMGYQAVALGESDLRLPTDELLAATANFSDASGQSRFVAANVGLFDFEADAIAPYRIVEKAGVRIGITAVLGQSQAKEVTSDEVKIVRPADALAQVVPKLKSQCQVLVLLAHASNEEAASLAKQFPDFDVVASAGGADEPPAQPIPVAGSKTLLVDVGHKGMYAIVLAMYGGSQRPWRYQRVPLDSRFGDSPQMKQIMAAYQDQLQQEGFSGLGLRSVAYPLAESAKDPLTQFAGAASCQECHPTAYGIWSKTPHAHATETLTRLDPPRQFDPECVSCHATGWNPQEYFPYESGFAGLDATPQLAGNGCENCHGPAAAHVTAERARGAARNLVLRDQLRQRLRLTKATIESTCEKCHDHDNSPNFDFARYWPKVEHHGKK
jgi:hypothetical protein